jgi:uncharacterized protein YeaO (DUF488 family)
MSAAFVDIGLMLLSAFMDAGVLSTVTMFVITGALPVLAIATVCAIDGNVIKTRSVWSDIKRDDGLRILATRFRGRGLPTSRYDVWMPSLGPSEALLRTVQSGSIDWKTFAKKYREELYLDGPIDDRSETIKNHGQRSTLRLLRTLGGKQNVNA